MYQLHTFAIGLTAQSKCIKGYMVLKMPINIIFERPTNIILIGILGVEDIM